VTREAVKYNRCKNWAIYISQPTLNINQAIAY